MSINQVLVLVSVAVLMSLGQLLLKIVANRIGTGSPWNLAVLFNWYFAAALAIYVLAAILWILALRYAELSRAHPFIVLSFVFTPLLAWSVLGENLTWNYGIGLGLICAGLAIIVRS